MPFEFRINLKALQERFKFNPSTLASSIPGLPVRFGPEILEAITMPEKSLQPNLFVTFRAK